MRRIFGQPPFTILLLVLLAFAGCQQETTPTAPPEATGAPALQETAPPETPTEDAPPPDDVPPTDEAQSAPATASATTAGAPVASDVPDPGLFQLSWQERGPFEAGLVDPAEARLPQLQGASVYHMDLTLGSDVSSLTGSEEIYYTNQEDTALEEVYLRLFPNLAGGSTTIQGAWINGQTVEPEYELRNSAMRLPLSPALEPGQSVVLKIDFEVDVPIAGGGNYGTFIYDRDILALAHFYPMIAVYDDEGWNLEIAPESGDVVYADSSLYLVRISAPAGLQLAASGAEIEGGSDGERQQVTFAAGPARDFYLAASAGFDVYSEQVGETVVNSYAFPEVEPAAGDVLDWSVDALQTFEELFGSYPYTELDVVSTPTRALGVEYPGIIVINMDLYDPQATPYPPVVLESTVAHEVAHQWFYAVVGNDQVDEPWLDESLTQYATYLYFQETGSSGDAQGFRQSLVQRWQGVDGEDIPIGQPVAAYEGPEYSAIVYGRGPLFFEALAEEMGQDAFHAFVRDYYQTLRWDIATPQRLQSLAEEACGCELDALFEEWVYGE
ncbi:MAG: M1 family metallopeptidase [Chloroflexota bacterium]